MSFHAKAKAAIDADIAAWTPGQVRDFNDHLVRDSLGPSSALVSRRRPA
jgi:hypothetical protein